MSAIRSQRSERRKTLNTEILPTNLTTKKYPIHRWFNFVAGFSPEFVDSCIDNLSERVTNVLLDPFTGCATSQVEGIRNGMKVIGYEAHPFFSKIANAKTHHHDVQELKEIYNLIQDGFNNPEPLEILSDTAQEYLGKLYSNDSLIKLLGARVQLEKNGKSDLGYLILSKIFDLSSHAKTDGIYKAPTSSKKAKTPEEALNSVFEMIHTDLNYIEASPQRIIHNKSSESMSEVESGSVDIIVTSPPYLNNFDFAEMTRHYLYFWGEASSWSEITELVRTKLIVNTTTALKGHKNIQLNYRDSLPENVLDELDMLVNALNTEKKSKAGKKEYDLLVYPYFSQMQSVLRECLRVLRVGGQFNMMVSDAALYGVHISAPQILADIMNSIGFKNVSCVKVRSRGHRWVLNKRTGSEIGLGEYHIKAGNN